jgi:hypothetical protein
VTNSIPLGGSLILPVGTANCIQTLKARTGNIIGPILAHAFSNYMGFPDFDRAVQHKHKYVIGLVYVLGLSTFLWKLGPYTDLKLPLSLL